MIKNKRGDTIMKFYEKVMQSVINMFTVVVFFFLLIFFTIFSGFGLIILGLIGLFYCSIYWVMVLLMFFFIYLKILHPMIKNKRGNK